MTARTPTAKSLAVDLLSTMPRRYPVAVGALVRAGTIVGIGENSMRVALARLRARGLVESDERGFYRLGPAAEAVNRQVRSWRTLNDEVGDWDGSWIAVDTAAPERRDRKAHRARVRALRLLGFESLTAALAIRPNNLVGGVGGARDRLEALGHAPRPFVFRVDEFDGDAERRARALWNVKALEAGYAEMRDALHESERRLPTLAREEAMAESFLVGGEAVRRIVLDPMLPAPIVDTETRGELIEAMRGYDRIGREYWKAWAGESVEPERSPADVGAIGAADAA